MERPERSGNVDRRCVRCDREGEGGGSMNRQNILPPGLVALAFMLALVALQIAIMVEVGR